ncbi:MAG: YqgE/AlgH family protein [Gammaproteobacteria bacterium]|nr:YqgE/AlgH family protein [Gammaproteobacteria bacterium]
MKNIFSKSKALNFIIIFTCLIALLVCNNSFAGKKRAHGNLSQGVFLVATDKLNEFSLKNSVIYITQHDGSGTSGFIVNRPTNLTINEAFPDTHASNSTNNTLYFGGPLHSQYLFILTQTKTPEGLYPINREVHFGTGEEMKARLHSETKDIIRTYAGFMSWGPGQLEEELTAGDWVLAPGNIKQLFSDDTSEIWKNLYHLWAGSWT